MYLQALTGTAEVFGKRHKIVGISRVHPTDKSSDDRIFLDQPVPVPGTNYSRKSFKRSEIKNYKAS